MNESKESRPPRAKRIDRPITAHDHERVDPYYWLRERESPEVRAYLEAENAYTREQMKHTEPLQLRLYDEIVSRLKPDDSSVPYRRDGFYYYHRFEANSDYPIFCRKPGSLEAPEQIMLDANELATGKAFFSMGATSVSSDNRLLAFATDEVGRRIYRIRFKRLDTGELLEDEIAASSGNLVWAEDGTTLVYSTLDPQTLRSHRILSHRLGSETSEDRVVFEEADETFSCHVYKTKSKRFLMIVTDQTLSSEYRFAPADRPNEEFRILRSRRRDHEYDVDHHRDHFYIRSNEGARNFRLMRRPVESDEAGESDSAGWEEVVPHRTDVFLEDFSVFEDHLVLEERYEGLPVVRVIPWDELGVANGTDWDLGYTLSFDEPAYSLHVGHNPEMDTAWLRFRYSSLRTPGRTYEQEMNTMERHLLKEDEVVGPFRREDYSSERLMIEARDGVRVPVSIVYHRSHPPSTSSPLVIYAYGSYGYTMEASFGSARLSLLDRGFVYAIAHVRGGSEKGRPWYDDGKLLKKMNTFTDFIDVTRGVVERGLVNPRRVFAHGGSAGGLLVGAILNMAPDDYYGVVAEVPFVDVVTTMLDETIPLTTGEYDEWGSPHDHSFYQYMLRYSPYDNVAARSYPHLLVTAGLHDSQVQFWEPAKWVAKLRHLKTDDHRLLLHTNLEAGHSGASGRYRRHRETALVYAFILDLAGIDT